MIFGVALSIVIVVSAAVLGWQWWTGVLADPLDKLPPLSQGRRPNGGYGKQ